MVRRITVLDSRDDDGLTAIATPLVITGSLVKVAQVVLLGNNRNLLVPQIERTSPTIVEEFHRHL